MKKKSLLEDASLLKIVGFTRLREHTHLPAAAIWAAMKEYKIADDNPDRMNIFKDVAAMTAHQREEEREAALAEKAEKIASQYRDAAAHEARQPKDAY